MTAATWLDDVGRFALTLDQTQQDLLTILRSRRQALADHVPFSLERFNEAGRQAALRLQALGKWRQRLLDEAHREGRAGETLVETLAEPVTLTGDQLRGQLLAVQQRFEEVRREAWIEWVVTQRSSAYFHEVLELVAQGGIESPVYGDQSISGGAMLDAAA